MEMLTQAAIFLGAAVALVPIFKRVGLGAIIGYLVAGALIGPAGAGLITDVAAISQFAEFGVVLLLFVIGLELQPRRLWTMRAGVFGLGGAQVLATAIVLGAIAAFSGQNLAAAAVIGLALALSSTAFVLQTLGERGQLATRHGRAAFAVLLFQDLAAIPILAVVPFLDSGAAAIGPLPALLSLLKVVGVLAAVMIIGPHILRPSLRIMAHTRVRELFTAITLLIVTGTALVMHAIGLSMALGAFIAGVLLANSEFRHELEADIDPFKGLFLGLFFISVGMGLDLALLLQRPLFIIGLVAALLALKGALMYGVARAARIDAGSSKNVAAFLAQGGEFAFVIFAAAVNVGVLDGRIAHLLTLVVTLSMAATPFVAMANDAVTRWFARPKETTNYDTIPDEESPVIIAGFGRVGQMIGRVLAARRIKFTALDINPEQVEFLKRFGHKVYYGDATRIDLLRAARADKAKIFVLAVEKLETSLLIAQMVVKYFPNATIYARARNRPHAYKLMDLGVTLLQRDTFLSALDMAHDVLLGLGLPRPVAAHTVQTFRIADEKRLFEHYTYRNDAEKLTQLAKAASKELEEMFARDAGEQIAAE